MSTVRESKEKTEWKHCNICQKSDTSREWDNEYKVSKHYRILGRWKASKCENKRLPKNTKREVLYCVFNARGSKQSWDKILKISC